MFLAALFAILGSYVFFFEKSPQKSDLLHGPSSVFNLRGSEISALSLELGDTPVELEKEKNHWFLRKPVAMRADADAVESMLAELEFLIAQRVIEEKDLDIKQYGLAGASKKIRLKTSSGEKILFLGRQTPIGKTLYAQLQGSPVVYVIADQIEKSLNKTPEDLRNRVVLEFTLDEINKLSLTNPAGVFELEQQKADGGSAVNGMSNWKWAAPRKDKQVDQEALSSALWELRSLKFKKYLGEQGEQQGKQKEASVVWAKPLIKVEVFLKGQDMPKTLLIGQALPDGSCLCKMADAPGIFTLDANQVDPLKKDLSKALSPKSS